jgi:pSer/pThr/pTyr-binding forkhead associated (FHA) protein
MFKLILKFQDAVLQEYVFEHTPVTIGRRDGNDIAIDNMAVSGRHAQIEMDGPDNYVLVDLESLNGTYLSDKKVSREVLDHGDSFLIGKHHLTFEDLSKPPTEKKATGEMKPATAANADQAAVPQETVQKKVSEKSVPPQESEEPTEERQEPKPLSPEAAQPPAKNGAPDLPPTEGSLRAMEDSPQIPQRTRRPELKGTLTILSGGIPQILDLTKMVTTVGNSDEADVKCSGWLVGKMAALINKTPYGFFLKYHEGTKKPHVNGEAVSSQVQLQDGDEIVIGSTKMTFNVSEEV